MPISELWNDIRANAKRRNASKEFDSFPPSKLLISDFGPETFVVSAKGRIIGREVYLTGGFDFGKFELVQQLLGQSFKRDLLLDIGANIGTICIPAVKRGIFSEAMAFEPVPSNFSLLKANIILNHLEPRISSYNVALSSTGGQKVEMELSTDNSGDHRIRVSSAKGQANEHERETISVPTQKLDDFAKLMQDKSTLIWMDTQGFEGEILSGAKRVLSARPPLVTEFWPYGLNRTAGYVKFRDAILAAGYENVIDIRQPQVKLSASSEVFDKLKDGLGDIFVNHTDLLIT